MPCSWGILASPWTAGAGPRPAAAWCGDGLEARRHAGALPGMVFLVAPAEDRTNPGPPELINPDEERRTEQPTPSAADDSRSGEVHTCAEQVPRWARPSRVR